MIDTSGYRRFERVDHVEETDRGLLATLHGERLRIDVVRADVVRFKISRGGAFDETPTFAVTGDPIAREIEFAYAETGEAARITTDAIAVTVGRDPFRIDVHRAGCSDRPGI